MVIKKKLLKKKLYLFIIPILIIFTTFIYAAVSIQGHSSDEILVTVYGTDSTPYTMTLQEAINGGYLMEGGPTPTSDGTTELNPSHLGSEVKINLGGTETTIQNAINSGASLCREQTNIFSGILSLGHGSDKVDIITIEGEEMTLQNAINTRKFCYIYEWKKSNWEACSVPDCADCESNPCGEGTMTRTVWCEREDGQNMGDRSDLCIGIKPDESAICRGGLGTGCGKIQELTYGTCTQDCSPEGTGITQPRTITDTCASRFDTQNLRNIFCNGMTAQTRSGTSYVSCSEPTEYINKQSDLMEGPYFMKCVPKYTENQWIPNPFTNSRLPDGSFVIPPSIRDQYYQYVYLKCDWDMSNLHCGRDNDGCLVWFSYFGGEDPCRNDPVRNNDDCNALANLWATYSGSRCEEYMMLFLKGCSLNWKTGYCLYGDRLELCYRGCTPLPEQEPADY